ncbi:hypothetical protein BPAE_0283g00070 [Botrytis paeoniae]|uniref:Uncharacterized protein n=1 Tax=Botrytis paeoniae TaxID=278948 RepID=A0A4Z1F7S1_9HELO|nr:hypothetical protein BPAE_0283g00070 [Botrytis paeoniae]
MEENHETTSLCRGKSLGRPLSLVTDLAPPSQQPCPPQHPQHPQNLNSAYPVSAPPLAHHNQINPLSALPLTQHHPLAIPQPQPCETQLFNPEHPYLLLSLFRENFKALSLRQKIAAAETNLASIHLAAELEGTGIGITSPLSSISTPTTPHSQAPTRRKLKKQISWLKYRIKECTRQERILMERLQQIGEEEEERRWIWTQIERQRRINEEMMEWQRGYWNCFVGTGAGGGIGQNGYGYSGGGYGFEYGYGHGHGHGGMLNASTPAFQPGGSVSVSGACPVDAKVSVGGRKYSNEFWNMDAPIFSPVNFFKPSSSSTSISTSTAPSGISQQVQNGEVERLSRGWDECELSPLAEERRRSSLKWSVEIRGGDKEGNEMGMGEEGEDSGSGEGEAGDSSTGTAITTPTPQQSARMSPMGGAKSCNDVMLEFFDGVNGEGKRGLCGKEGVSREKKSKSLPGVQKQRWEGVCGGKGKLCGKEALKERNESDQVW